MCGIAGIVAPAGEPPDPDLLNEMGVAMAHRGPDDAQVRLYGRAGFSFRRLSIIDLAGGSQPLDDERGRIHVILNGEIYNHRELRAELEAKGHLFRTRSDAESIVHGYEEWGEQVVPRLAGMFALAVWDEDHQRLLLARDRFGKKPLIYHAAAGRLAFASEFRALLVDPRISREPNLTALDQYLAFGYVPAPLSAIAGIYKLPPGHVLVFERTGLRLVRYWSLPTRPELSLSEPEAAAELLRLLRSAVRARLMSDVPLGAFLSGGLDSSSVVALMAEMGRVKTFSIGFGDESFNELPFARLVAERYATEHHEFVVEPKAAEVLPQLVDHYGEPFADSSALPTYYLSRMTAGHVKVALNGDGADELLGGYDRYRAMGVLSGLARLPGAPAFARQVGSAAAWLPPRARRFLRSVSPTAEEAYTRLVSCFLSEERRELYNDALRSTLESERAERVVLERFEEAQAGDLLGRTLYVDALTYLPGDLLVKVDIASMAWGLECRCPFLDHRLAEFAAGLPTRLKLRDGRGKHLLRVAMADKLPREVLERRKQGFGVPIGRWLRNELRALMSDHLLADGSRAHQYLRVEAVRKLAREHQAGAVDHGHKLWALLVLELWLRRLIEGGSLERVETGAAVKTRSATA